MVVSSVILIYHATTAYLCTFLTSDPLYMSFSVTAYAWYGCALAMLGIYGSYKVPIHTDPTLTLSLLTGPRNHPPT
jgi:hypothetical protein